VLQQEHIVYPLAVRWFAEGRLRLEGGRVRLGAERPQPPALISP
jgi:phosphoribosylglycinamide formyltransferase-1